MSSLRLDMLDDAALYSVRQQTATWASICFADVKRAVKEKNHYRRFRSDFGRERAREFLHIAMDAMERRYQAHKELRAIDAEFFKRGYAKPPTRQPALGGRGPDHTAYRPAVE